jgi:hypothetical protein
MADEGFDPEAYLASKEPEKKSDKPKRPKDDDFDPVVYGKDVSAEAKTPADTPTDVVSQMQSSGMEFLRGMAADPDIVRWGAKQLGIGAKTKQPAGEGTVKGGKVPEEEPKELTGPRVLGSMIPGAGAGAAAVKGLSLLEKVGPLATKEGRAVLPDLTKIGLEQAIREGRPFVKGPMAKALVGGAAGGAVQPASLGPDYWERKAEQVGVGVGMGFGLSVGGKVASAGLSALGDWLARDNPALLQNRAIALVLDRINKATPYGAPTAKDMLDLTNAANARGKPMALIDIQDQHRLRSLGGHLSRRPGAWEQVRAFLANRDALARTRIAEDINRYVSSGSTAFKTVEGLQEARTAASRPFYEQTDALQGIWSPRLEQFLNEPYVKRGLSKGYVLERLDALAENKPFDPTTIGVDLDANGEIKFLRKPNMRVLDMGKKGLDAIIESPEGKNQTTGRLTDLGRELAKVRNKYVEELDALDTSGVYKKAREIWSGYSASLDAVKNGKTAFERTPEENEAFVGKMTENDKEFARIGLADTLREKLAKAGLNSDESLAIVKNDWSRQVMRPYFKTESDFNNFVQSVLDENTMARTKNELVRGSQTPERMAADQQESQLKLGAIYHTAKGLVHSPFSSWHWLSAVTDGYKLWRQTGLGSSEKMDEMLAKILFSETSPENAVARLLIKPAAQLPPTPQAAMGQRIHDVAAPVAAGALAGAEREVPE